MMLRNLVYYLGALAAFAIGVRGQESTGPVGGGYGYTVVSYDAASNTVTVNAETDVDDDIYYTPQVDTTVKNNEGYLFASGDYRSPCTNITDSGYASTSCTIANANANDVYAAISVHRLSAEVTDYDEGINDSRYYDADGFNSFESLDLDSPFGEYYDPPYLLQHTSTQTISLGKSNDSDSAGKRAACGDVRDTIIQEYITKKATFTMISCSDFAASNTYTSPGGFSFLQLAPTQTTGYGQFPVIQSYMATYLRNVFSWLGSQPAIDSGYRNPVKEASVGHYYPNSRHMAGDAVDLDTRGSQSTYILQRTGGLKQLACVEPVDLNEGPQRDYLHAHLDWRTHAPSTGHFAGPGKCPPKWTDQ